MPQHLTVGRQQQAAQHAQQTGLACPIGTAHPQQFARFDSQRQAAKQLAAASGAGQVVQLKALAHGLA